jgi:hypothetical protein
MSGAFVAGLEAGLIYNEFPLMGGRLVPAEAFALKPTWKNFFENDAMVQFTHRALVNARLFFEFDLRRLPQRCCTLHRSTIAHEGGPNSNCFRVACAWRSTPSSLWSAFKFRLELPPSSLSCLFPLLQCIKQALLLFFPLHCGSCTSSGFQDFEMKRFFVRIFFFLTSSRCRKVHLCAHSTLKANAGRLAPLFEVCNTSRRTARLRISAFKRARRCASSSRADLVSTETHAYSHMVCAFVLVRTERHRLEKRSMSKHHRERRVQVRRQVRILAQSCIRSSSTNRTRS